MESGTGVNLVSELSDELSGDIVDVLERLEERFAGSQVEYRAGKFAKGSHFQYHAPTILAAYHNRDRHGDQGLYVYPIFGDGQLAKVARDYEEDAPLPSEVISRLVVGTFCINFRDKIIGWDRNRDLDLGRDSYRCSSNVEGQFGVDGTSIDVIRAFARRGFRLVLMEVEPHSVSFGDDVSLEEVVEFPCSS